MAASCTPGQAMLSRRAHTAREELIGLSRDDVLRCAGEPTSVQHWGSIPECLDTVDMCLSEL